MHLTFSSPIHQIQIQIQIQIHECCPDLQSKYMVITQNFWQKKEIQESNLKIWECEKFIDPAPVFSPTSLFWTWLSWWCCCSPASWPRFNKVAPETIISCHLLDFNVLPHSSFQILHNLHPTLVVYKAGDPTTLGGKRYLSHMQWKEIMENQTAIFKSYAEKRNYGESDKHFYLATSNPTNSASSMNVIWWVQWEVVVEDMIHLGV